MKETASNETWELFAPLTKDENMVHTDWLDTIPELKDFLRFFFDENNDFKDAIKELEHYLMNVSYAIFHVMFQLLIIRGIYFGQSAKNWTSLSIGGILSWFHLHFSSAQS